MFKRRILRQLAITEDRVDAIYAFGSRVYGCARPQSDHDFLVIAEGVKTGQEIRMNDLNLHLRSRVGFEEHLRQHKVIPLECLFAPDAAKLTINRHFAFRLDTDLLRREWSKKSNDSADKAIRREDPRGLYHAVRIVLLGRQIIQDGAITDYGAANHLVGLDFAAINKIYTELEPL